MQQQRLFDKELDNQHEEPLLLAQLAAAQLRSLLLAEGGVDAAGLEAIVKWASQLARVGVHLWRAAECLASGGHSDRMLSRGMPAMQGRRVATQAHLAIVAWSHFREISCPSLRAFTS